MRVLQVSLGKYWLNNQKREAFVATFAMRNYDVVWGVNQIGNVV